MASLDLLFDEAKRRRQNSELMISNQVERKEFFLKNIKEYEE